MRTIKLSAISLLCLLLILAFGHSFFSGSTVQSQANSLSAPTGVTASDNAYSTKVGISWDTVRSATLYRIFRNAVNDPAAAISVGTTAEGTLFDPSASAGQTYFYWVRAENGIYCVHSASFQSPRLELP
jgi:hypothetical protein